MSETSAPERREAPIEPTFGDVVISSMQGGSPAVVYKTYTSGSAVETIALPDPDHPRSIAIGTCPTEHIDAVVGHMTFDDVVHTLAWAFTQAERGDAYELVEPSEANLVKARESFASQGIVDDSPAY